MTDATAVMLTTLDYYEKRLEERDAILAGYRQAVDIHAVIHAPSVPATDVREMYRKAEIQTVELLGD